MAATAGFACVGCVRQDLINSALRAATASLPAFTFSLPNQVTVGGTQVGISGVLAAIPPQVILQTRADNLVSVSFGFAGQLQMSAGGQSAFTEILLSTNVLLGLVANVAASGNVQQITIGLNPTVGTVTAVNLTVISGPPLATIFNSALTSPPVLNALTSALRAMPANLLQVAPQNINIPQQIVQTYQPPGGSIFLPDALFQMQFTISRIVARPLNAAEPGQGVLVVAIDAGQPVATTGDPNSLTDLTSPVVGGPTVDYEDSGTYFAAGSREDHCDIALYIDSSWVTNIVNNVISPQLANKFPPQLASNMVCFSNEADCLQISFGNVTASLDDPLSPPIPTNVPMEGMNLQCKMTKYTSVSRDNRGYYQGTGLSVGATFNAQMVILLMQNGRQNQPKPQPPALTNDYYTGYTIGHDISLPWWVDVVALLSPLGQLYLLGTPIASLFGVDIFYPTLVANANNQAGAGLDQALGGLFEDQKAQLIAQLPGTTSPNWYLTIPAIATSTDACYSCLGITLLSVDLDPAGIGSYPYVMLTDQPVTNPNQVPNVPSYPFPVRFEGSFYWPGISYNQAGSGAPGGSYNWDVHDLNPIGAVLKIPPGLFNPLDPTIFVSWTATRTDTNAQLVSQTLGISQPGALAISIAHSSSALQGVGQFQINCQIFRILAIGGQEQIFNSGSVYVNVQDHLDRSHPYFFWSPHDRYIRPGIPFWTAIPAPKHTHFQRWVKTSRQSRIHRTDYWSGGKRCLVAETAGLMGNPPSKGVGKGRLDYVQLQYAPHGGNPLDHLPLSLSAIQSNRNLARGVLCDYCFFGGPTRTGLRTDFPTPSGLPQQ